MVDAAVRFRLVERDAASAQRVRDGFQVLTIANPLVVIQRPADVALFQAGGVEASVINAADVVLLGSGLFQWMNVPASCTTLAELKTRLWL
jgi:hypothetical protein